MAFTLVGRQSGGQTTATVNVTPAAGPVEIPPNPPYKLPPDLAVHKPKPPSSNAGAARHAKDAPQNQRQAP